MGVHQGPIWRPHGVTPGVCRRASRLVYVACHHRSPWRGARQWVSIDNLLWSRPCLSGRAILALFALLHFPVVAIILLRPLFPAVSYRGFGSDNPPAYLPSSPLLLLLTLHVLLAPFPLSVLPLLFHLSLPLVPNLDALMSGRGSRLSLGAHAEFVLVVDACLSDVGQVFIYSIPDPSEVIFCALSGPGGNLHL